ncbi:MAG: xanthine dehydrogenase family protein [Deltaproteobacteria bacterium]|nr:xanthine dehydrogenase family protein [Deltaproteobacteria bacterium]
MSDPVHTPEGGIGASLPRVDGAAKVTGAARYVDDIDVPGAWHARTVRSTVPHANLRAIRLDPAFDWTNVVVVTAEDIPGKNVVTLLEGDQPALVPVGGRIRHVDEAVAVVVAPTKHAATEAMKHVSLDVEALPAVFDAERSLAKDVLLHGTDNVFKKYVIEKGGDVDAALASADVVIEGVYRTGAQEQMYIEPQGMIAQWEGGRAIVTGSLQCPYYVHKALKVLLGLPDEDVVVRQAVTGGGFGGKEEYPSMIGAHAIVAAKKVGRPVRIVYDRAEDVSATTKRHPSVVRHRMGLRRDGTLVAVDVDVLLDGGAYVTLSPVVLSRAVLHASGPYRAEHVRIVGRVVATNTPPHGAFRGFGAPQTTFAYERQIAKAARALGMDPFTFRRHNMYRLGDITATGQKLEYSVASAEVLDAVDSRRRTATHRTDVGLSARASEPVRRGKGLCFYFHGAGFTGSGEARLQGKAAVVTTPHGFEVRTGSTDIGQGMLTTFTQIAATALDVPVTSVVVAEQNTARVPDSGPTVASRTCMVVGWVVENASKLLRAKLESWAKARQMPTDDLVAVARAHFAAEGETGELVTYQSPPGIRWDDATYRGDAYPVFGWAACWVEVAVDTDTWEVAIERCIHAVDVGCAMNPVIVQGQIEGGTLQALGWALWESVQYRDGRVLNKRMTDCIIPTSMEAPEMETLLVEVPYPFGPHGAKGVGEIPMDGPAAAVANAVEDALGIPMDELPILPETIERAVRRATRGTT